MKNIINGIVNFLDNAAESMAANLLNGLTSPETAALEAEGIQVVEDTLDGLCHVGLLTGMFDPESAVRTLADAITEYDYVLVGGDWLELADLSLTAECKLGPDGELFEEGEIMIIDTERVGIMSLQALRAA